MTSDLSDIPDIPDIPDMHDVSGVSYTHDKDTKQKEESYQEVKREQQRDTLMGLFVVLLIAGIAVAAVFIPSPSSHSSPASFSLDAFSSFSPTGFITQGSADSRVEKPNTKPNAPVDGNNVLTAPPTFMGVVITAYYIPDRSEFTQWCGAGGTKCDPSIGGTAACKTVNKGAYEAGKCNGQLKIGDKFYSADRLKPTEAETLKQAGNIPKTSTGTKPEARKTIAVNAKKGSACYIPEHSKVYIQFPDANNPYTGWYDAEDTGGMFAGKCKIDIFAGYSKDEFREVEKYVSGKQASVWVCEPSNTVCKSLAGALQPVIGTYDISPAFTSSYKYNMTIYDTLGAWAEEVIADCTDNTDVCVKNHVDAYNAKYGVPQTPTSTSVPQPIYYGPQVAVNCDKDGTPSFNQFAENIIDCMNNNQSDCLCIIDPIDNTGGAVLSKVEMLSKAGFTSDYRFDIISVPGKQSELILYSVDSLSQSTIEKKIFLPGNLGTYRNLNQHQEDKWSTQDGSKIMDYKIIFDYQDQKLLASTTTLPGIQVGGQFQTDSFNGEMKFVSSQPYFHPLVLYKENYLDITIVPVSDATFYSKPVCKKRKVDFRFCNIPPDALSRYSIDKNANPKVKQDLYTQPILFSMTLRDDPPNPVENNIKASYNRGTGRMTVEFSSSLTTPKPPKTLPELTPDVTQYEIYCSNSDFPQGIVDNRPVSNADPALNMNPIYTHNQTLPVPKTNKAVIEECWINGQPVKLEDWYLQNLGKGTVDFYVMVVPVDKTGQFAANNPWAQATMTGSVTGGVTGGLIGGTPSIFP